MAVSKRLRFEILRRDNHACRYCGGTAPDAVLTVDHVVPVALGGTDVPENLVAACKDCNAGKSSVPADAAVVDDVAADALRWLRAMRIAQTMAVEARDTRDFYRQHFEELWNRYKTQDADPRCVPLAQDWRETVDRFVGGGLDCDDLREAVEIAMRSRGVELDNRFRYFCGVAWRMVEDRQRVALGVARSLSETDVP